MEVTFGFHKGKERKVEVTTGAWRLETKIVCNTGLAPTCNARNALVSVAEKAEGHSGHSAAFPLLPRSLFEQSPLLVTQ